METPQENFDQQKQEAISDLEARKEKLLADLDAIIPDEELDDRKREIKEKLKERIMKMFEEFKKPLE